MSGSDYERMLDLAIAALNEQEPRRLWPPVVRELLSACGGRFLAFNSGNWTDSENAVRLWTTDGAADHRLDRGLRKRISRCWPMADHYGTSADRTPRTASQIVGDREWRSSETAELIRDALGADHLLCIPLPDASRPVRGFLIYRAGSPFTETQLAYAQRVQPLLAGVDKQDQLLRRWHADEAKPPPESRQADSGPDPAAATPQSALTPRQVSVLLLLADALTAAAIGRRLGISVRTVQKHIESIYRKLGTSDRVATVLRAQEYGLIPVKAER
jgi:DNA-binding CsgD family transcriptional regulator